MVNEVAGSGIDNRILARNPAGLVLLSRVYHELLSL